MDARAVRWSWKSRGTGQAVDASQTRPGRGRRNLRMIEEPLT